VYTSVESFVVVWLSSRAWCVSVVCVCVRRSSSRLEEELAGQSKVRMKRDLRDVCLDMLWQCAACLLFSDLTMFGLSNNGGCCPGVEQRLSRPRLRNHQVNLGPVTVSRRAQCSRNTLEYKSNPQATIPSGRYTNEILYQPSCLLLPGVEGGNWIRLIPMNCGCRTGILPPLTASSELMTRMADG
jgi:hypothetical protein